MHVDQGNMILNLSSERFKKESQELQNVKTPEAFTDRELTRAIRDAIVGEENAIKQYETIVDASTNEDAKKVIQKIADEERVHVGELQKLLIDLLSDEQELLDDGAKEVEDDVGSVDVEVDKDEDDDDEADEDEEPSEE